MHLLETYFERIFYINRNKDVARNEKMIAQFKKFGINNYERVEAIELTELPEWNEYRNFIRTNHKYIIGSLSCRLSHLKCISLARKRNNSKIMILEDDVIFLQNPHHLLAQNLDVLGNWHLLYFGGLIEPHFRNQIVCAHAYAVKNELYDDILNMAIASGMEIDNFYAKILQHMSYNYSPSGKYDVKIILPFNQMIQDKSFVSNIQ